MIQNTTRSTFALPGSCAVNCPFTETTLKNDRALTGLSEDSGNVHAQTQQPHSPEPSHV